MPLQMDLSGYNLRFLGGITEPPNYLIFRLKDRFESCIILEETKQRASVEEKRKILECFYRTMSVWGVSPT